MRRMMMSVLSLSVLAGSVFAQGQNTGKASGVTSSASGVTTTTDRTQQVRVYVRPEAETLSRMMKRVSVNFQDTTVESAINFIQTVTSADLEVMWLGDNDTAGLTKETLISAKADNLTALRVLEMILERADAAAGAGGEGGGSTWQMSDTGAMQIGPRERLNKFKRTEIYDISDLVLEIPNYDNAPELDLQQALQASQRGGGGGSGSPFRDEGDDNPTTRPLAERTQEVLDLITTIVESEQWQTNGGDGGSIQIFQGKALVVKAPDYMHRGINGYSYWPSESTTVRNVGGRRYVSLGVDTATSQIGSIENASESAVVGGTIVRSNPPGGSVKPAPAQTPAKNPGQTPAAKPADETTKKPK